MKYIDFFAKYFLKGRKTFAIKARSNSRKKGGLFGKEVELAFPFYRWPVDVFPVANDHGQGEGFKVKEKTIVIQRKPEALCRP